MSSVWSSSRGVPLQLTRVIKITIVHCGGEVLKEGHTHTRPPTRTSFTHTHTQSEREKVRARLTSIYKWQVDVESKLFTFLAVQHFTNNKNNAICSPRSFIWSYECLRILFDSNKCSGDNNSITWPLASPSLSLSRPHIPKCLMDCQPARERKRDYTPGRKSTTWRFTGCTGDTEWRWGAGDRTLPVRWAAVCGLRFGVTPTGRVGMLSMRVNVWPQAV